MENSNSLVKSPTVQSGASSTCNIQARGDLVEETEHSNETSCAYCDSKEGCNCDPTENDYRYEDLSLYIPEPETASEKAKRLGFGNLFEEEPYTEQELKMNEKGHFINGGKQE